MMDIEGAGLLRRLHDFFPNRKSVHDPSLPGLWKVMNQRKHHVELDWEVPIWCLDPVPAAYTSDLFSKFALVRLAPDVLDDGVAEHDIESCISERQDTSIRCHETDVIG